MVAEGHEQSAIRRPLEAIIVGAGSIIFYLEHQAGYVRQALELPRTSGAAAMEVRADVEAADRSALTRV